YNFDGYMWQGRTHLHYRWCDFGTTFPVSGSSQVTFLAALNGLQPVAAFDFQGNTQSLQLTQQSGGPSRSKKYFQRIGYGFASEGGIGFETDSRVPTSTKSYSCWKQKGIITGKIFRVWPNGWSNPGSNTADYYLGSGAAEREASWPYDAGAWYNNYSPSNTVFQRHVLFLDPDPTLKSRFFVDSTQITFGPSINGNQVLVTAIPLTISTDNARGPNGSGGMWVEWPNAVDSGGTIAVTDIYFDWTPARVEITVGSKTEIQIVNSWIDTEVKYSVNAGELPAGTGTENIFNASNQLVFSGPITVGP